jgi:putative DNA primase/helicase
MATSKQMISLNSWEFDSSLLPRLKKGKGSRKAKLSASLVGDRIVCRELWANLFEYDPQFKLWLATNDLPQFSGGDQSMARRIRVIEFPVTFDEESQDRELQNRLLKEAPGILNWVVEGYVEWKRQELNAPEAVMLATKSYRIENDTVGQFMDACCCLDPNGRETAGELYETYESWCHGSGLDPMPKVSFGKELKRHGFESIKGRSGNGWRGLRLQRME